MKSWKAEEEGDGGVHTALCVLREPGALLAAVLVEHTGSHSSAYRKQSGALAPTRRTKTESETEKQEEGRLNELMCYTTEGGRGEKKQTGQKP